MDVKTISIDAIGLSARSANALCRAGIHTVGDMLNCTETTLADIKNLGRKSIEEILQKTEIYKKMEAGEEKTEKIGTFTIPEDFDAWLQTEENRQMVVEVLKEKNIKLDVLELLPSRAYNLLLFSGYEYLYQVAFFSKEKLMEIPGMDEASAAQTFRMVRMFIKENKDDIIASIAEKQAETLPIETLPVSELLLLPEYHDVILHYVKENDIEIEHMGLSSRPKNRLIASGFKQLSDIIFKTRSELLNIPSMGTGSVEEILRKVNEYLTVNESRIRAVLNGDETAQWDDDRIQKRILELYKEVGFGGLSFEDIVEKLSLPESITTGYLKSVIGRLIADKKLEYVDYRCYRVYDRFEDALSGCTEISERSRDFIRKRLQGATLEEIAQGYGLSRERIRQVVKRDSDKVKNQYRNRTGIQLFDEDYFQYLYETYSFEKKDGSEWLGIPQNVWQYLDLKDVKRGQKDLSLALEDKNLDVGLRLKIKNYLNRDKLYVDGIWIEKKRSDLEQTVVRKFCKSDVTFDEFCHIYNEYLEQEEIPYDEDLYITESVYRSRKNHLSDARFLLWKQNEKIRYYDIDGRDYTELLDTLNMDAYENIEFSTVKFMRDYPEIMERYDIRDQYELHNLLRKIVPEGSYHDFHCGRMPEIKFGSFDRDAAILDILIDNSPISIDDLVELISDEYGYDPLVIKGSYLQTFSKYYHQGMYMIDQKEMPSPNKKILQEMLSEDFYYIDEIRKIYARAIPDADIEEVNPYNLKAMGFSVYSRYAVQHYPSLEAFFHNLLTSADILDITEYRKRFAYVQMFSQKLMELKKSLQMIEFEPNQLISFKKLEKAGVTREMIQDFCSEVYDFVKEKEYFSAQSLKLAGFESELYDLGFSDWFYANLLISDDRFSFGNMFGNLILFKGKENITIKLFETALIEQYGYIDAYDLMSEMTDKFGCRISDKWDVVYKVQDTEVYYDKILDRLYASKDLYYKELEGDEF